MIESFQRFYDSALPSGDEILVFVPVSIVLALIAGTWVGQLRTQQNLPVAYTRKLFHVAIFTTAGIMHLWGGLSRVLIFGTTVFLYILFVVMKNDSYPPYRALAREKDAPHETLFILIPLITTALGGVVTNLFFLRYAYVGYIVSGWGDAVGEPVGARWGKHRYHVPSLAGVPAERSWEGSLAVMFMGTAGAAIALNIDNIDPVTALGTGLACGIVGALVEAISNHGLDNLTVQIAAAATAYLLLT